MLINLLILKELIKIIYYFEKQLQYLGKPHILNKDKYLK